MSADQMLRLSYSFFLYAVITVFTVEENLAAATSEWQVLKGKHFLIHYCSDSAFAGKVASKAEEYYDSITVDLGFARYDNFWLWEKRVKVLIYGSRNQFIMATGAPVWAIGKTEYSRREISTFPGDESFIESVLPHEMTHLIFRDFVGFKGDIPLWLNEGVAQWEEPLKRENLERYASKLAASNQYIPFSRLMLMDVKQVIASGQAVNFYRQAMSMVGFLIKTYGSEKFRIFCGEIRDGRNMDDSLRFAYPESLRNIIELEKAWKKYVTEYQEAGK